MKPMNNAVLSTFNIVAPRACAGRGLKRNDLQRLAEKEPVAPRACAGRGLKRQIVGVHDATGKSRPARVRGARIETAPRSQEVHRDYVAPRACAGRGLKLMQADVNQIMRDVAPRACAGRGLKPGFVRPIC